MRLTPDHSGYLTRLLDIEQAPSLNLSAPLEPRGPVVAIVGSRAPVQGVRGYTRELAKTLARAGITIVSGGAIGVDTAAHEGALEAGGTTWVVPVSGRNHPYPKQNADFFDQVSRCPPSAMVWAFADDVVFPDHDKERRRELARARNKILVALADAVVVVQAKLASGSRNAANLARQLQRPVWAVPGAPWEHAFAGSNHDLEKGLARPLWGAEPLLESLLSPKDAWSASSTVIPSSQREKRMAPKRVRKALPPAPDPTWTPEEKAVVTVTSTDPAHLQSIALRAALPTRTVVTALLTLTLKNVVVEGPDGFYRLNLRG